MKLDKIVLNGFKSFADKTEFTFDQPITAIVGPNGCGKSNVVDAFKWVLGNQSPKSLRSGQMLDVIFGGSTSRKPSAMAEVNLSFSNVAGLGIDQDCLEISRRLYRSGESEYMINRKVCRLKDIRELFMDTGVGVSAYSIIEQGQIDQLLQSSKVDRRTIFEEAAGISKYKAHKKEALRKLERTEQNLLRLADIVSEVTRQLRSIKLQAGKARSYLQYSQRLKELRVSYSLAEYHKIVTQRDEKSGSLADLQQQFAAVVASVAKHDTRLSELNNEIIHLENLINQSDNSLIAARSRIEQQLQRIEMLKQRSEELSARQLLAEQQVQKLCAQDAQITSGLDSCTAELAENEQLLAAENSRLSKLQTEISSLQSDQSSIQAVLEDEKSGIIDLVRRTAQLHNEIQSIGSYRDSLTGQKSRLNGRVCDTKAQIENLLTEKAGRQARLNDITKVIEQLQQRLEQNNQQTEDLDNLRQQHLNCLTEQRELRSSLSGQYNALDEMEQKREGLSDSLKNILKEKTSTGRFDYIEGIVADIISAKTDHANLIEAALHGKTDCLVISDTGRFLADSAIHEKIKTRVNIICLDRVPPIVDTLDISKYPGIVSRAVELVSCSPEYTRLAWHLLGRILVVESAECAMELSAVLGADYTFITPDTQTFDGLCCIGTGPVGKTSGLISRKSRLNQLRSELEDLSRNICEAESAFEQYNKEHQHLIKLSKDLRTSVYEVNTEKVNTESAMTVLNQNIKRLADEQPLIAGEIELLEQQINESVQKEYDSKQKLAELEQINTQRNEHIAELEAAAAENKTLLEEKSGQITELKVLVGRIAEKQKSARLQIAALQGQLEQSRSSSQIARNEIDACKRDVAQSQRDILTSQSAINDLYLEKEKAQETSSRLHQNVENLIEEKQSAEQNLRQNRASQTDLEQQIHQIQLELSQLQVKDEDLNQRVREELQMNLAEEYENFQQQDVDWEQVREEIADLRGKIERLGNVNVDAIEQQDQLEQRYNFLTTQLEDLNQSKSQLEHLIGKINKESRDKFAVTFEQIRANFQDVFRKLFGGGKADVFLEDPNDILECGIEIIARPPGKETRSISLLSGGEKTLTALALLFSVFKTKPSPFCVLDEVDAALDEANNERFNLIVQEFQKNSQFIIITHAKRTMSIADVLYGITMQIKGVSKKISVKFDSIEETEPQPETAVA